MERTEIQGQIIEAMRSLVEKEGEQMRGQIIEATKSLTGLENGEKGVQIGTAKFDAIVLVSVVRLH